MVCIARCTFSLKRICFFVLKKVERFNGGAKRVEGRSDTASLNVSRLRGSNACIRFDRGDVEVAKQLFFVQMVLKPTRSVVEQSPIHVRQARFKCEPVWGLLTGGTIAADCCL